MPTVPPIYAPGVLGFHDLAQQSTYQGAPTGKFRADLIVREGSRSWAALKGRADEVLSAAGIDPAHWNYQSQESALRRDVTMDKFGGYAGNWMLRAKTKHQNHARVWSPLGGDAPQGQEFLPHSTLYPGCIIQMGVLFFMSKNLKYLTCSLDSVQWVKDGERLDFSGGGTPPPPAPGGVMPPPQAQGAATAYDPDSLEGAATVPQAPPPQPPAQPQPQPQPQPQAQAQAQPPAHPPAQPAYDADIPF